MQIKYYYIIYIKNKKDPSVIEIHALPFKTEKDAQEYKEKFDKECGERFVHSKIKKVDLSKHEKGFWL